MPFGALSAAQKIMIRLQLLGGPQYRKELEKAGIVTKGFTNQHERLGKVLATTNKRTFLHNQLLFTMRRAMFYTTFGTLGLAAAVSKLGFSYLNVREEAEVALRPIFKDTAALKAEMNDLFKIAAFTPFSFQDITKAFRVLFVGMKPLGISAQQINDLLLGLTDTLSFEGILTPVALKRVSVALQDMANQGQLTGRAIFNLSQLGIPLKRILREQLHLVGDDLEDIADSGITVKQVITAITKWAKTEQGVAGAALRQSNETLFGAWSTFKDLLSQAVGESEKGIFGFIRKTITGVNTALATMSEPGEPVTLTMFAEALDKQLSPSTHLIINLFNFLQGVMMGLAGTFFVLFKAVGVVLAPFNFILSLFGANKIAAKALGIAIGVLGAIIITSASIFGAYRIAVNLTTAALWGNGNAIKANTFLMKAQLFLLGGSGGGAKGLIGRWKAWAFATQAVAIEGATAAKTFELLGEEGVLAATAPTQKMGFLAKASRALLTPFSNLGSAFKAFKTDGLKVGFKALALVFAQFIGVIVSATIATWGFVVALWATGIPQIIIGVTLLALALVLLYRKWQPFRDVVDWTFGMIIKHWKTLVYFIPFIGQIAWLGIKIADNWKVFDRILKWIIDKLKMIWGWVKKVKDVWNFITPDFVSSRNVGAAFGGVKSGVNWLFTSDTKAEGGPILRSGPVLVGEKGPEIVMLPRGSHVIPNDRIRGGEVNPITFNASRASNTGDDRPIVVQVMLDRKVLAQGVARANQDYVSRR